MNIIIRTYKGNIVTRPDTSWKSRDESFFAPGFVKSVSVSPVMFLRICKAGKCVPTKFASRYYDAIGYGFLLYAENIITESEEGFSSASCLDHTTFIPDLNLDKQFIAGPSSEFELIAGNDIHLGVKGLSTDEISVLVEQATSRCLVRTADIIAVELSHRECLPQNGRIEIKTLLDSKLYQNIEVVF